jgi:hypothetical protein
VSGDNMDTDSRVKLAEIGGDIKRIFDFITRQADDTKRIDTRLNHHGERLTTLENAENQRLGMIKSAKIMWLVMGGGGGVVITGLAAIIARAKGL